MEFKTFTIRPIAPADNAALASIIRRTLEEFKANHPGTVYYDDDTDRLSEVFMQPGSWYFVAEQEGSIVGGAGVFPTPGLPDGTCELVKMYLLPQARGTGLGKFLLHRCFEKAHELGYTRMYLETMPELTRAIPMYEQEGFRYLDGPMGNSGHFGCAIQMIREL
ncbi:MAG: GNAT family N-acetyltransferase [Chitinophagaceae bacterium]|nr:GNAT family N-acetyltransferase [Chitinophagaceae bacterium]